MTRRKKDKSRIQASQILAVIVALGILMFLTGFNPVSGIQSGVPLYTIEGSSHIAGQTFSPNVDIQTLNYEVRKAGFFDFTIVRMGIFEVTLEQTGITDVLIVAEDVSCRAMLLGATNNVVKSTGYKGMGDLRVYTDEDYQFSIPKIQAGDYTLRVECKWLDGYNKRDVQVTVG